MVMRYLQNSTVLFFYVLAWVSLAITFIVRFPRIIQGNCFFQNSWLGCASDASPAIHAVMWLIICVFVGVFIIGGYMLFRSCLIDYDMNEKYLKIATVVCLLAACVALPVGSGDVSYYYAAGQAVQAQKNIFIEPWARQNQFAFPNTAADISGFTYGPITASIFRTFYQISGNSFLVFTLIWKALSLASLVALGMIVRHIVRTYFPVTNTRYFMYFWLMQPLVLFEVVVNGHFDIVWLVCVLIAIWLVLRKKWFWVVPALVIGIWIKFVPLLLAPVFALWWWSDTKSTLWLRYTVAVAGGLGVGGVLTYVAWKPFWHGFAVFNSLILQSKWAVNSLFSALYFTAQPLFVLILKTQAHWYLTRFVQGALVLLIVYLLYPILVRTLKVLVRKQSLGVPDGVAFIFIGLVVYLAVWQKSFWPWYTIWLMPFAMLLLGYKNIYVNQIMIWVSVVPLVQYALWMLVFFVSKTDAATQIWYAYVNFLSLWALPLYWLVKWRKRSYQLLGNTTSELHTNILFTESVL